MTIRTNDAPMLKYGEQSNLGPPLRIFESLPPLGPRDKVIVPIFEDLKFYLKRKKNIIFGHTIILHKVSFVKFNKKE